MINNKYNLKSDKEELVTLKDNRLLLKPYNGSILLKIFCQSRSYLVFKPKIQIAINGKIIREQYLSTKCNEEWYIDLTDIIPLASENNKETELALIANHVKIADKGILLYFKNENQSSINQGTNLIIAPHPDDGELSCTSLYNENSYILTITAGQKLINLEKQYFDHMDQDIKTAVVRKGKLRSFNAITTPILSNVPSDHLICLGYLDATLSKLKDDLVVNYEIDVMPKDFRQINGSKIFSKYSLFENPENSLNNIKAELLNIIKVVKPSRIFITNPFLDHHNDHKAMGELLLSMFNDQLLGESDLYFYALHAKKEKDINFGPAGSFISLPYYLYKIDIPDNIQFKYASSVLTEEQLKMKTIMMNNMFDLYFAKDHRWYAHKTIKYFNSKRLGKAYYYHRFAKQNEVFLKIEKTLPNQ